MKAATLTGPQRAAVLLAQLDTDRSAKLLKAMSETDVVNIMAAMASLPALDPSEVLEVMNEFTSSAAALLRVGQGGVEVARKLLAERLGSSRAEEVIEQLTRSDETHQLGFLYRLDAKQIYRFIAEEHPQTIAVVLAHLAPDTAAQLLALMEEKPRADVVKRVATMGRLSPDVLQHLAQVLDQRAASLVRAGSSSTSPVGGIVPTVAILNQSDRATEKQILASLEERDPLLADRIRNEMFVFDDVMDLDDRTMQLILRHVVPSDLAIALKSADERLRQKFLSNLSDRASTDLLDEIEMLGPIRVSQVEAAQSAVVRIVRDLESSGEIVLNRGEDEFV